MSSNQERTPSEVAAELLQFISPDLDRTTWASIGMALKYELPEDQAYHHFRTWSEQSDKFKTSDFNDTWRSIRAGNYKMATLYHYAKLGGYTGEFSKATSAYLQQRSAEREKEIQLANEAREQERRLARRDAQKFWGYSQKPQIDHAYLVKKGITNPIGIKEFVSKKSQARFLQIPCFNKDGVLMSLQSISETGFKKFQKGAQIMGGSMSIGKTSANKDLPVIICEGWATGISLNKASGLQTVVAFNSMNLPNIAKNVREAYPQREIIIAADNDYANTAGNVGVKAAEKAASSIGNQNVYVIKPEFTDEELTAFISKNGENPSDFNDMDVFLGEAILFERVENQIKQVIIESDQSNGLSV